MANTSWMHSRIDRRKLVAATAGAAIAAPMLGRISVAAQDGSDFTLALVTDTAGIGDQSFNDLAKKGADSAVEQFGIELSVLESQTAADYVPNLTQGAEDADLTAAIGFLLAEDLLTVATDYPDSKFLIIDSTVDAENVASVTFKENQGAFLAGVLAALTTQTGKVGFIGGQRIPPVIRYEVGFVAGAKSVNPDIEVQIAYVDSFEDPATGKEFALAQFNNGADVLQQAAGRSGIGLFDAAKEKGDGFWVISADADQAHLGPDNQLAAVQKGIDAAILLLVEETLNDEFTGGVQDLGVAEGGVDLIALHESVSEENRAIVATYKAAIADGTIVTPVDDDTLAAFTPVPVSDLPAASPEASPAA